MSTINFTTTIEKLPPRKGSYQYVKVTPEMIEGFEKKHKTRFLCTIDEFLELECGLSHLGDGNFFIIISNPNFKKLNKQIGEEISIKLVEHPHLLGVYPPEILDILLEQDSFAKQVWNTLTDGKKRSLIFNIKKIKNEDLKIRKLEKHYNSLRRINHPNYLFI